MRTAWAVVVAITGTKAATATVVVVVVAVVRRRRRAERMDGADAGATATRRSRHGDVVVNADDLAALAVLAVALLTIVILLRPGGRP
jgi:hypothetical protein